MFYQNYTKPSFQPSIAIFAFRVTLKYANSPFQL